MLLIIAIICAVLAAGSGILGFLVLAGGLALFARRLLGLFFSLFVLFLILELIF
jgi:hypothetical protein